MWFRVFGTNSVQPELTPLLDFVRREIGYEIECRFRADEAGWFQVKLDVDHGMELLTIDRYLAAEEGIRAELNTWAAWLETAEHNPNHGWLMQHMIRTTQVFTFNEPSAEESVLPMDYVCLELCRWLATATDGVYQVDGEGFYGPDGTLLLEET